jgi:hypothetical protein
MKKEAKSMAKKVTEADIINMNELYLQLKTYAAVARETGFSASTVKKYIISNYTSQESLPIKHFDKIVSDTFLIEFPDCIEKWGALLTLTENEKEEMKDLGKEILI